MRHFLWLIVLLFVVSCANQGQLVGGDKDETPPRLLASNPPNETLNFPTNTFELFFDENIKVKDLNKNLLVSPFLKNKPKVKVKPRSILVQILDTLQPNTTYTFNFGNAIQDLNEGNELQGFSYVFSTGEVIDSAKLSGSVIDAVTGEVPEKGAWALLYESLEDSLITTSAPAYATPITEEGVYNFHNVKDGEYRLVALRDNNFNYYYDLPNEEIAYTDSLLRVSDSTFVSEPLYLFSKKSDRAFVKKSVYDKFNSLFIETSQKPQEFDFDFQPNELPVAFNVYEDSIRYWFGLNQTLPDSAFVNYQGQLIDTAQFRKRDFELKDSIFKVRLSGEEPFVFHKPLELTAKRPFTMNENLQPILLEDSLFVAGGVEFTKDSLLDSKYYLNYDWAYGKSYILEFDDSLFTDVFGLPSDSLSVEFKVPLKEDLGVLNVSFLTQQYQDTPIIYQLMKGGDVFYETKLSTKNLTISDLPAGKYATNIIIDANGNGKWDSGDYEAKTQPEKVLIFDSEIDLRANWDLDIEIDLDN